MFYDDAETGVARPRPHAHARNKAARRKCRSPACPSRRRRNTRRLVRQGYRVAVCEQVEDPSTAKGIVRREVDRDGHARRGARRRPARVATRNNFICRRRKRRTDATGDGTTRRARRRRLVHRRVPARDRVAALGLSDALGRSNPAALVLVVRSTTDLPGRRAAKRSSPSASAWEFDPSSRATSSRASSGVASLDGLGIERRRGRRSARRARCSGISRELQPGGVAAPAAADRAPRRRFMLPLDEMTRRNLELVGVAAWRRRRASRCCRVPRPHGHADGRAAARQLGARAALRPTAIDARLDAVAPRCRDPVARDSAARRRSTACATSSAGRPTPRRAGARRGSCARSATRSSRLPAVARRARRAAAGRNDGSCERARREWDPLADLADDFRAALVERPPVALGDGDAIAPGFDAGARRAARAARRRRRMPSRAIQAARARAHRHRVAQGRLQQGLRVLHRDHARATGTPCPPTTSAGRR